MILKEFKSEEEILNDNSSDNLFLYKLLITSSLKSSNKLSSSLSSRIPM